MVGISYLVNPAKADQPLAWGWCSSPGLRQADLGQIIDEVGYSLVLEGVIDL